jgi:hypothetical protein
MAPPVRCTATCLAFRLLARWKRPRLHIMTAADAAEAMRRRRQSIMRRLARVNAAITQWQEVDADHALPEDFQRHVTRPDVSREDGEDVRQMLRA